jgi:hypothetical protein
LPPASTATYLFLEEKNALPIAEITYTKMMISINDFLKCHIRDSTIMPMTKTATKEAPKPGE